MKASYNSCVSQFQLTKPMKGINTYVHTYIQYSSKVCNLTSAHGLPVGKLQVHPQNSQQMGTGACKCSYLCQVPKNTCLVSATKNLYHKTAIDSWYLFFDVFTHLE